jgi:hypothetical protein
MGILPRRSAIVSPADVHFPVNGRVSVFVQNANPRHRGGVDLYVNGLLTQRSNPIV